MKKKIINIILLLSMAFLGIIASSYYLNPLRKEKTDIRISILEITPIGMSIDEVLNTIESKEWTNVGINQSRGVSSLEIQELKEDVGYKSIKASIGKYNIFFETHVLVWWAFDEDSKLVDVFVRKDIHAF